MLLLVEILISKLCKKKNKYELYHYACISKNYLSFPVKRPFKTTFHHSQCNVRSVKYPRPRFPASSAVECHLYTNHCINEILFEYFERKRGLENTTKIAGFQTRLWCFLFLIVSVTRCLAFHKNCPWSTKLFGVPTTCTYIRSYK